MRSILLLVAVILAGCGKGPATTPADPVSQETPVSSAAVVVPSPLPAPLSTLGRPACPRPVAIPSRALATGWPSLLGRRVRLRVVPVRAIDFTEWLVEAGGQRFLVMASPDTAWGVEHVFVVAGSSTALVHGRTVLPELILDDGCDT